MCECCGHPDKKPVIQAIDPIDPEKQKSVEQEQQAAPEKK